MNVSQDELRAFSRDFTEAVNSTERLPIEGCLRRAAEKQSNNPGFQKVLLDVRDQMTQGIPVSEAMARHPDVFSKEFVAAVRRGETSGCVDTVMEEFFA